MTALGHSNSATPDRRNKRWLGLFAITLGSFALLLMVASWGVFAQNPLALPVAHDGEKYTGQLPFSGGTKPITYILISGPLPAGIGLDSSTGALTGLVVADAQRPKAYPFVIQATDSAYPTHNVVTQNFSITVEANTPLHVATPVPTPVPTPKPTPVPFVFTSSENDEETISLDQEAVTNPRGVDANTLVISNADLLIADTIGTDAVNANFELQDYCVIHLIRWKPVSPEGKSDPQKDSWALFERIRKDGADTWNPRFNPSDSSHASYQDRIYGSRRVVVLPIHFNTPSTWDIKYKVSVTQQIPTPISDLLALAGAIKAAPLNQTLAPETKTVWGARLMLIKHLQSELVVKVNAVTGSGGAPVEQSKEYTNKYTNEGRYHWDVSVGLPVKTVRELTFVSDPTNGNRLAASAKERQDAYGFLNIFPKAVDLKSDSFLTWPHFLFGVPLASKPLHRPIVGLGTGMYKGPVKFNIFAGVVFIRERVPTTLSVGQQVSQSQLDNDLHTRWVRKFTFGINFPISQIKQALK